MKILVISSKKTYVAKRLIAEAKIKNLELKIMDVASLARLKFKVDVGVYDCLYVRSPYIKGSPRYIPNIVSLAKKFKAAGKKVVDVSIARGRLGEGKWVDYRRLVKANLPIPKTVVLSRRTIPKYWPFILKWTFGIKGKNVFLIRDQKHFNEVFKQYPKGELLVQEFIPAEYEYKIITVGYKALPVVLRFAIHPVTRRPDFKQHTTLSPWERGGVRVNKKLRRMIALAQKASKTLGRELAKVDILEYHGKFYILEVNRFPGLDSFEQLTKYNVVKDFISYLQ